MSAMQPTRRTFLATLGCAAMAGRSAKAFALRDPVGAQRRDAIVKNGRLKQSVSRWPYNAIPLPAFCDAIAGMGLTAIDLLEEPDWAIAREHGLTCSMGYAGGGSIRDGLNVIANHDAIVSNFARLIPRAAAMQVPNVITFFGNRRGMSDEIAIANCITGLNRVKTIAEDHGVTICVELLNSKVNHPDYQGDRTAFGVAVVKAVASPRVKLLYDIYHMQIMEGDVIATVKKHKDYIAHYHTGGVPGRNEIDETQELNYPAIVKAILATGYAGFLGQEFIPKREPIASLGQAYKICDV